MFMRAEQKSRCSFAGRAAIEMRSVAIILKSRFRIIRRLSGDQRMANLIARNQMEAFYQIAQIKLLIGEAFWYLCRNKNPPDKQHTRTFQKASIA